MIRSSYNFIHFKYHQILESSLSRWPPILEDDATDDQMGLSRTQPSNLENRLYVCEMPASLIIIVGGLQAIFVRCFQVSVQDIFGQITTVDLKKDGSNIPVTEHNRMEYVDLCVKVLLCLLCTVDSYKWLPVFFILVQIK